MSFGTRFRVLLAALGVALLVLVATAVAPTEARWQDSEIATSALAAGTRAPIPGTCTAALTGVTVQWSPPPSHPAPTGYRITATNASNAVVVTADLPASETSYRFTTLLGTVGGASYTIALTPQYANAWTPTALSGVTRIFLFGLLPTCPWTA